MIPALDTFDNMRECLGAISVTLPTASDLLDAQPSKSQCKEEEAAVVRPTSPPIVYRLKAISKPKIRFPYLKRCRKIPKTSTNTSTKTWNRHIVTRTHFFDMPFVQQVWNPTSHFDALVAFINRSKDSVPSWEAHTLETFYRDKLTSPTSASKSANGTEKQVWYFQMSSHEIDPPEWLHVLDLGSRMWKKVK
jgi:hypothetical protein